ncbi:putative aminopeptidase YsdC [Brevibacillus reuszeri]|uniref:Aminopeptidase YsdC n=1 Tax=Brevibacillus reuszeri TaxID=54915 RepID=A0A0K9YJ56_9BACL|nr:M42 family metallopeptidase [Brevibacillus reuszeri]KNB68699.1 peptidase M28 [Brevibacillus reuszeri]MED1858990.1 M42 family metallopeptidase [Brevibacillus reuszeri]GED69207.1 putative aminopeptidase YsdC [Brevibacillus reuszeri]
MDDTTKLIKELTEVDGVPGHEREVRKKMEQLLGALTEELVKDRLGGVLGKKTGAENGPKILLAGHLDEIGFMVTHITSKGYLRFIQLGGWWPHNVLSQRVKVKTRKGEHLGIIGSKPPHALEKEEREKVMKLKDLYIDIGAKDEADAKAMGVRAGDWIVPASEFTTMRDGELWVAKALDNRAGCALAVEVLNRLQKTDHPNIVYGGATVQEEVGSRGAGTVAQLVEPDIAFALDVGIAYDTPGNESYPMTCNVGDGPLVMLFDATMIPHTGLRDLVMDTAEEIGINVQVDALAGGGTDAAKFHTNGIGCPSLVVGFATRYIHSHNSIMAKKDFEQAAELLVAVIKKLDRKTIAALLDQ